MCFPGDSVVKNPPANAEDTSLIPGLGRSPGKGNGNLLQYPCVENLMGQRSLAGYSPWGHKESDTTWRLNNNSKLIYTANNDYVAHKNLSFFCGLENRP